MEFDSTGRLLRWASRIARTIACAFVGAELVYLVVMNLALSTPLLRAILDADPQVIDVHYARAWSFVPTRVTARDLRIRGADSHVQWVLELDRVTFDCSVLDLVRRHFHVTRARGSGVSFRLRHNVESPRATAEYVRDLPPIDGFGPVGFEPSEPPYAGTWSDADWHLWTVHLENVVAADVREVWLDGVRFRGSARVAGGFYLRPIRAVHVGPLDIQVAEGRVQVGRDVVLAPMTLDAQGEVSWFDPRVVGEDGLVHRVTVTGEGEGAIPELADTPIGRLGGTRLRGAVALPRVSVRIGDGALLDGTVVEARAPALAVRDGSHVLSADASTRWGVVDGQVRASTDLRRIALDDHVLASRATVALDARGRDLAKPLPDLHAVAEVPDAGVDDARELLSLVALPGSLAVEGGRLRASARAEAWRADRRIRAEVNVRAEELRLRFGKPGAPPTRIEGNVALHLVAVGAGRRSPELDFGGSAMAMRDVATRGPFADAMGWSGDLLVRRGRLDPSGPAPHVEASLALQARNATPLLSVLFAHDPPELARELSVMPHFAATVRVAVESRRIVLSDLRAGGGNLGLRGVYVVRDGDGRGAFVIDDGPFSVGIRLGSDGAHVHLFGLERWFREQEAIALSPRTAIAGP